MTNEEIFNNNVNIAYKIANRYITNYYEEIEDIRQIALMELWRCVEDWDHIHALTTYAYIRIPRKINIYLRHVKKNEENISINTIIHSDGDGNEQTILDTMEDPEDYIEYLLDNMNAEGVLDNIILNSNQQKVLNLRKNGFSQAACGKIMGLSQCQISRIQKQIKDKINTYINGKEKTTCLPMSLIY